MRENVLQHRVGLFAKLRPLAPRGRRDETQREEATARRMASRI
jgi:hypothetical protein